jgi:type IV secretion system protein VirB1
MDTAAFVALVLACAPQVHTDTARALVRVAKALQATGWNFSVGLGQINVNNWARLGLGLESAFDPCTNLMAMQMVLTECFDRARQPVMHPSAAQAALLRALSCYYSGNFTTGFRHGYVRKVLSAAAFAERTSATTPAKEKT